jgi:murein DD-endopeptidase MepM/ murein hydrolase activator NlpD
MRHRLKAAARVVSDSSWLSSAPGIALTHAGGGNPNGVTIPAEGSMMSPFLAARSGARTHAGIDIAAPRGAAVMASESGTVIRNQWQTGYGNTVDIRSADGRYVFRYGHLLNHPDLAVGQHVACGQQIANVGASGTRNPNTGFHLHTEVRTWESYQRAPFARPDVHGRHDPGILDPSEFYHLNPQRGSTVAALRA